MAGIDDHSASCPSLELPNSNRCSFYFTRLSVDEEGFYSVIPKSLVAEVREGIGRIPEALTIIEAYKELARIDLLALLNSPRLDLEDTLLHKLYQTGLYAILALYIKRRLGLRTDAVGFYSGGATSAFLFAGAYTARISCTKEPILPRSSRGFELSCIPSNACLMTLTPSPRPPATLTGFIFAASGSGSI